ncbi:MAG: RNA methyltransferase, partial [Spirochaetaceae bacterium]|nr:RNA methyltransferase [Spirochaetaceae bacterium]
MKNKQFDELAVCGYEAVKALAAVHPEHITRFFYTQERMKEFGDLCRLLASERKPYRLVDDEGELEKLCGSVHHQGVAAMIPQQEIVPCGKDDLQRWIENRERVLVLDGVGNANNLGAIVRSAAFFGIRIIVLGGETQHALITTSTYRIAQGGMEYVRIYSVRALPRLLKDAAGRMIRIGTAVRARIRLEAIQGLLAGDAPDEGGTEGVLLVLGNEE